MDVVQSDKLEGVAYDVRGPVLEEALRLEQEGHRILRLNIGNPAPFGLQAPEDVIVDVIRNLPAAQGYSDSKGLLSARRAVEQYHLRLGVQGIDVDDVYLGNGVSELIAIALQALLNNDDEVLIPAPDYPLWTAVTSLCRGRAVHYLCDEEAGWYPDLGDVEAQVTGRTRALVVINPNNPTGAVYPPAIVEGLVEIARRHGLVLLSDEIYDRIVYDGARHVPTAALAPDVLTLTFNGLSKAYRVAGFRSGWMVVSGPKHRASSYIEGLDILANMRLCANVPGQHAIQAALGNTGAADELVLPGARLVEQRDRAWELLNAIPGVSCVKPMGALYTFPRLDPSVHRIQDDERLVLDLLRREHILVVQGTGFNWPRPDHLRIVTLPAVEELADAIVRIGTFLADYRQPSS
ncbi:MAG TPA: pyridoxal phosphate-dependent aminotransferase [Gaiellales bacterium]|jgi:alanine-synthesizing transaminase|nr:pyridoxal phosphate-dependent aminotransferase [Gaiellales bacterium]